MDVPALHDALTYPWASPGGSSGTSKDNPIVLVVVGLLALVAVSFVASVLLAVAGVVGLAVPSVATAANALADGSDPCVTNVVSVAFVGS